MPTGAAAVICVVVAVIASTEPGSADAGVILQIAVLVLGVLLGSFFAARAARAVA